jgi:hypothetical protein
MYKCIYENDLAVSLIDLQAVPLLPLPPYVDLLPMLVVTFANLILLFLCRPLPVIG